MNQCVARRHAITAFPKAEQRWTENFLAAKVSSTSGEIFIAELWTHYSLAPLNLHLMRERILSFGEN